MSESVRKYLLLALTGLLTVNLFFSITTSLVLSFIIIAIQLVCLRKEDSAFLFLLLGSTFGAFYAQNGVRFVGSFLVWGSALYLLKDLISYRKNWFANYRPLLFFIFLILFSILITTGGSYSKEKFIAMMMNVVPYTIAFSHLILYKESDSFCKGTSLGLFPFRKCRLENLGGAVFRSRKKSSRQPENTCFCRYARKSERR